MLEPNWSNLSPALTSPYTPPTMRNQPMKATSFAIWTRSSSRTTRYLSREIRWRAMSFASYTSSGSSRSNPKTTIQVAAESLPDHTALVPTKSLAAHSANFSTTSFGINITYRLIKLLKICCVLTLLAIAYCVVDNTIDSALKRIFNRL